MNKISLAIASMMVALGAWATPVSVLFYSEGPDRYADGSVVLDGEVYALVLSKGEFFVEYQGSEEGRDKAECESFHP